MVVVNSRTASRLEHLAEILGQPDRLATVHGSCSRKKPDQAIPSVAESDGSAPRPCVARRRPLVGGPRQVRRDERDKDRLFTISDEDAEGLPISRAAVCRTARRLLPRLDENGSYTFVVGDGAGGSGRHRSHQPAGLPGHRRACRHEAIIACKVNEVKVQVAAAPSDEASFPRGPRQPHGGVAGADAAAAVDRLRGGPRGAARVVPGARRPEGDRSQSLAWAA